MLAINFIFCRNCVVGISASRVINRISQGMLVIVSPKMWCAPNHYHEERKLSVGLNPTSISKHDLGNLLIPTIHILWCCREHDDAMFNNFDQTFHHPITLRPLGCYVLMVDIVVLTHNIKFCYPFPSIIN